MTAGRIYHRQAAFSRDIRIFAAIAKKAFKTRSPQTDGAWGPAAWWRAAARRDENEARRFASGCTASSADREAYLDEELVAGRGDRASVAGARWGGSGVVGVVRAVVARGDDRARNRAGILNDQPRSTTSERYCRRGFDDAAVAMSETVPKVHRSSYKRWSPHARRSSLRAAARSRSTRQQPPRTAEEGVENASKSKRFVPLLILSCLGRKGSRGATLYGRRIFFVRMKRSRALPNDDPLIAESAWAEARRVSGTARRICWLGYGERAKGTTVQPPVAEGK